MNSEKTHHLHQAVAYWQYPHIWVAEPAHTSDGDLDFARMGEEAYRLELPLSKVAVTVARDGLFVFDFTALPSARLEPETFRGSPLSSRKLTEKLLEAKSFRNLVLNAFQPLLSAVALEQRPASRPFVRRIWQKEMGNKGGLDRGPIQWGRAAVKYRATRDPKAYGTRLHEVDKNGSVRRWVLRLDALQSALLRLDVVLQGPAENVQRLAMYHFAIAAHCDNEFGESFLHSWSVTESLLHQIWESHSATFGQYQKRSDEIFSSVAQRLEAARMLRLIDTRTYNDADKVRAIRNKTVHTLARVTEKDSKLGMGLAERLLENALAFKLGLSKWPAPSLEYIGDFPPKPLQRHK